MINLSDRAVLVQLSRKRMRTSYRDDQLESSVRFEHGDESLSVYAHIFQNKTNPQNAVRQTLQQYDAIYALNKSHTSESHIRGMRILPSNKVFEHMDMLNKAQEQLAKRVPDLVARWSDLVAHDMACRGARAQLTDYPDASQVPDMFQFDMRILPLPSHDAVPLNLSPEVRGMLQDSIDGAMSDVETNVRADLIKRMLQPIQRAVERLSVPVGAPGTRFHGDALVGNLRDAVQQAKELNVSSDPDVAELAERLSQALENHMSSGDALKHSQTGRDTAKDELQSILDKMGI